VRETEGQSFRCGRFVLDFPDVGLGLRALREPQKSFFLLRDAQKISIGRALDKTA